MSIRKTVYNIFSSRIENYIREPNNPAAGGGLGQQ